MIRATCERIDKLPVELVAHLNSQSLISSPAFAALWRAMNGRPVCWLAREGELTLAALSGVEFGSGVAVRFQGMPDGLYAKVLTCGDEHGSSAAAIIKGISDFGYAKAFITDFAHALPPHDRLDIREQTTLVVDIHREYEPPDSTLRSEIRKAERDGTTFRTIDWSEDREPFLYLMEQTEERHKREPKYSAEFFDALAELATHESRVRWVICYAEDKVAASHIFLVESPMALHWQVYFDKAASHAKPNQFILFRMAHQLAEEGITTLNLGSSPPAAESLIAYKQKWGAREYHYPLYSNRSLLGRLI